ncbi:MAG: biotin carboxylase N-terminal domain-containing protein [Nocardioides sp.]|nr:biotin carboxylase N-terminal domain-containing protein [Nocardioides sp.]
MQTVLIANRGEIALRVIRTCRSLGLTSVVVHTDLDADAPHVREADRAVRVPGYLDVEAVVAAAREVGADAVHPGYGFLSERAAFATALEDAGIRLVGPTAAVIDLMGRKDAAREVAEKAGVPVVPAYALDSDPDQMRYPVLVKAAAGGGGKGMRIVRSADELAGAVATAGREAASAFGDDTLLIEKYVERGRHVEVQVLGDDHGSVVHLFERDCSTQRRHQKVLEEAPAPTIDEATRARVTDAAVALAAEVGYSGAGTVEFLLDEDTGEAYFLEMNTRLQVEHPVTELAVAVRGESPDLVALQLQVAGGEPLGFSQDDVTLVGHAIEARVYAEDPWGGFLPQAGRAGFVHWPEGPSVRVDAALETGAVVSTAFDPMLGKVVAAGPDRETARRRLVAALDDTVVLGLTTNTGFLRWLVAGDAFRDATIDTAWLDRATLEAPGDTTARAAAAYAEVLATEEVDHGAFRPDGWRSAAAPAPLWLTDQVGRAERTGPRTLRVHDSTVTEVEATTRGGVRRLVLRVSDAATHVAWVQRRTDRVEVVADGQHTVLLRPDPFTVALADPGAGSITAPMPGTVLELLVEVGQQVAEGERLGAMEAMKMELALTAPYAGTVTTVGAAAGEQVTMGHLLVEVSPTEDAPAEAQED